MKKWMLTMCCVCAVMMFGGAGCEENLAPAQLQALVAQQEVLQQQLDIVQVAATEIAEGLESAEIVDEAAVAKLAKINEEADRVQAQIAVIAEALKDVPLTGDASQDFIAQLQAANAASSGFNPYAAPVGVGLSVLSIILGWLARRNAVEAAKAQAKYQAHKQGVEKTMKEVSVNPETAGVETQLYNNIGEARTSLGV